VAAAACATTPLLAFTARLPIGGDGAPDLASRPSSGPGSWQEQAPALQGLDRGMFAAALGSHFRVALAPDAQPAWLTLLAVEDLPRMATPNLAGFAVRNKSFAPAPASGGFLLRFGSSARLPQESYLFQHDKLGSFALFIVPEAGGQSYTAIVNHLAGAAILAVPQSLTAPRTGNAPGAGIAPAAATFAPATSSGTDTLPRALFETPAGQRD